MMHTEVKLPASLSVMLMVAYASHSSHWCL